MPLPGVRKLKGDAQVFAIRFVIAAIELYTIVLLVRIVFSWLPPRSRASQFYAFLHVATEPVLRPFRRILPPMGGFDLSPILLFFLLAFLQRLLRGLLY